MSTKNLASPTEIQAVLDNGANLPQDILLRKLLRIRCFSPEDPLYPDLLNGILSLFFDDKGLLKSEEDYYLDWQDFCNWIDSRPPQPELNLVIAAGTPLDQVSAQIETFLGGKVVDLDPETIYHYNFLIPQYLGPSLKLLGLSIILEEDQLRMLISGIRETDGRNIFIYSDGRDFRITKQLADYFPVDRLVAMAGSMFQVSPFIQSYIASAQVEVSQRRTNYSSVREKLQVKKKGLSRPQDRIQFRVIRRVKRINLASSSTSSSTLTSDRAEPQFKVQVQGFWRRVKGLGKDQQGKPVMGKTWVHHHTRWNQKPEKKVVWVKEPLREV